MRILLPAHEAGSGGLGAAVRGLAEHVPRALPPGDELVVLGGENGDGGWQRPSRRLARLWREQVGVALAARDVDLVHLPDHRPLLASGTPFLLTVYDVLFVDHPEWFPAPVARYKQLMLRAALRKRPRLIVAGSEYTRARLMAHFPLDAGRVRVIYPGIEPGAEAPAAGGYFVTVSTIEPRKNHLGLLRSYRAARARGLDLIWKVVGAPGYASAPIIERLRAEPGVDVVGWVDDAERDRLYRGAAFAVYPSLAEGFGIPPLEAMARGVPVACSRGSSFDETVADAALRVEPWDEAGWTEALLRLASDEGERDRLRELGYARALQFEWPRAAEAYVAAYHDALS
jgi:glycosyltransferase involved in cell wall biosynthesis